MADAAAALENCRLYAARHRAEPWAREILRLCAAGGATASPLREPQSTCRDTRPSLVARDRQDPERRKAWDEAGQQIQREDASLAGAVQAPPRAADYFCPDLHMARTWAGCVRRVAARFGGADAALLEEAAGLLERQHGVIRSGQREWSADLKMIAMAFTEVPPDVRGLPQLRPLRDAIVACRTLSPDELERPELYPPARQLPGQHRGD